MASDAFAILADPTRRRLVEILHDGERSVGELVARVHVAQPGVSRHLRLLQEGGFVSSRPVGQKRLYSLRPDPLRELDAWMRRYAHDTLHRIDRFADLVEGRKSKK